jgi:ABC-type lipoprotein export system ATPase subunit
MVAIVGPSGSGKSTIMNMITGIDRPSAGTVTVDGQRIDKMSERSSRSGAAAASASCSSSFSCSRR